MAYNKKRIYNKAIKAIKEKKLIFVEDVVAYLPISKATLYDYFPIDSNELNTIKEALQDNKIETKVSLRSKWYESNAPALQIGLYKLIGNSEEVHALNGSKQEFKHSGSVDMDTKIGKMTGDEIDARIIELMSIEQLEAEIVEYEAEIKKRKESNLIT